MQGKQSLLGQFHVLFHTKIRNYGLDRKILTFSWLVYRSHLLSTQFPLSFIFIYWLDSLTVCLTLPIKEVCPRKGEISYNYKRCLKCGICKYVRPKNKEFFGRLWGYQTEGWTRKFSTDGRNLWRPNIDSGILKGCHGYSNLRGDVTISFLQMLCSYGVDENRDAFFLVPCHSFRIFLSARFPYWRLTILR